MAGLRAPLRPVLAPVLGHELGAGAPGPDPGPGIVTPEDIVAALGDSLRQFWYLTPDLRGVFRDATGTEPVTGAGDRVGMIMDLRYGMGTGPNLAEGLQLVFPPDQAGGAEYAWDAGEGLLSITAAGDNGSYPRGSGNAGLVSGRLYEVGGSIESTGGAMMADNMAVRLASSGTDNTVPYDADRGVFEGYQEAADPAIHFAANGRHEGELRFSVDTLRELLGNHARQTINESRPLLMDDPPRIEFSFDGAYFMTNFPDLGRDCTVARSVPDEGALIFSGQTISGPMSDGISSCAVIVVDRALTSSELALVTAFLEQRAFRVRGSGGWGYG